MTPQQMTECVTSQTNLAELCAQAIMKLGSVSSPLCV